MWLSILIVIGIVGGLALALAGTGPIGIVLVILGVIGLAAKFLGVAGSHGTTSEEHADRAERMQRGEPTGVAHEGQAKMTPEQIST